jgi:hypothetical protein
MPADKKKSLETLDAGKRDTVRKLVTAAAFAAPVISTFAIDGKMNAAFAGSANSPTS